ncbi:response regulator [Fulvivirga sediminis]|uniref:Response regulator n=1 Tax=Fulvivirga sediminis TaxID=2803949 RepID=A0A937K006_9BACT|nr:response regulator [Fulvivirga sediminis]MBL3655796.1 response regulator [Fulvivirga sediminis]
MQNVLSLLLIDDDQDEHDLFSFALEKVSPELDVRVYGVNSGKEAFSFLEKSNTPPPEFIFIDHNMPFLSGRDCLQVIRSFPGMESSVCIIYSSAEPRNAHELQSLGASHFFLKPVDLKSFSVILETLLSKQKELPFLIT